VRGVVPQYDDADGSGWIACRMLDVAATTNFSNHVHMGLCGMRWTRKEVDEQVSWKEGFVQIGPRRVTITDQSWAVVKKRL
jgi:hypothetical protein